MTDLKIIEPTIAEVTLRQLGMYCSERLGVDVHHLLNACNLLISDYGQDKLTEILKEKGIDWEKMWSKIQKINKIVAEVKIYYDPIQDKRFERKALSPTEVQKSLRKYFYKTASKLPLIQRDLYDLVVFLIKNNTIQRMQIPSDAFFIPEQVGFRRIDMTKKSQQPAPAPTERQQ